MKHTISPVCLCSLCFFLLASEVSAFTVNLTVNVSPAGAGTTSPSAGTHAYTYLKGGTQVNLNATPASGYKFMNWTGNVNDPNSASTYIVLHGNETVTANFQVLGNYMVTVTTNHSDKNWITFKVDGFPYSGSHTETWQETSQHSLFVDIIQYAPGYGSRVFFQNWNKGWTAASVTYEVPAYHDYVQANFVLYHKLTVGSNQYSWGYTVAYPSDSYHVEGSSVNLSAVANGGYEFVGWEGDYTGSENPVNILMNTAKDITAVFAPTEQNITIRTQPVQSEDLTFRIDGWSTWGEVTVSRSPGSTISLSTEAVQEMMDPRRYVFQYWSYGSGTQNTSTSFSYTVPDHDETVSAYFSLNYGIATHIAPSGAGSIDIQPSTGGWYLPGMTVTLTANPNTGYIFTGWSGDVNSTDNPLVRTLNNYLLITANFAPVPDYTLTMAVNPSGGGTTLPETGTHTYSAGVYAVIAAYASSGYQFDHWDGDVFNASSPNTNVHMNGHKTVIAQFKSTVTYPVTVTTSFPEKSEVIYHVNEDNWWGSHTFNWPPGSVQSISADSMIGCGGMRYVFESWSHGQARDHLYTVPSGSATLTANYMDEYSLNVSVDPEAGGTVDLNPSGGWYGPNSEVSLTASANEGYAFKHWLDGLTGSENPAVLTMDHWKHVIAVFDTNVTELVFEENEMDKQFVLLQSYPNPFNTETTIRYKLPKAGHVVIKIFDSVGREIQTLKDEKQNAGEYHIHWDASGKSSGLYVLKMRAGAFVRHLKMLLLE